MRPRSFFNYLVSVVHSGCHKAVKKTKASRPTLWIEIQPDETEMLVLKCLLISRADRSRSDTEYREWSIRLGKTQHPESCQIEFPNLLQQFSSGEWKIEFQDWIVGTQNEINLRASPEGRHHNVKNLYQQSLEKLSVFCFPSLLEITPFNFTIAFRHLQHQVKEKKIPSKWQN